MKNLPYHQHVPAFFSVFFPVSQHFFGFLYCFVLICPALWPSKPLGKNVAEPTKNQKKNCGTEKNRKKPKKNRKKTRRNRHNISIASCHCLRTLLTATASCHCLLCFAIVCCHCLLSSPSAIAYCPLPLSIASAYWHCLLPLLIAIA